MLVLLTITATSGGSHRDDVAPGGQQECDNVAPARSGNAAPSEYLRQHRAGSPRARRPVGSGPVRRQPPSRKRHGGCALSTVVLLTITGLGLGAMYFLI